VSGKVCPNVINETLSTSFGYNRKRKTRTSMTDLEFANTSTETTNGVFTPADLHSDPAWSALVADDPVMELLLTGQATTAQEAEALFLKHNVDLITRQVVELVESDLSEEALSLHPLALLLRGHGSRAWEDSLL
jgi:hypothetical protein